MKTIWNYYILRNEGAAKTGMRVSRTSDVRTVHHDTIMVGINLPDGRHAFVHRDNLEACGTSLEVGEVITSSVPTAERLLPPADY